MRLLDKNNYKKIQLPFKIKSPVLAFGSQAKNTLCFAKGNVALLSRIHSDLSLQKDYYDFENDSMDLLKRRPKILAIDLHQEYGSSKFAATLSPSTYYLQPVQHHHAHIASCMAENGLKSQKVIGVAFDGTGLGPDNRLWGAEFLICDYKDFIRGAHLKEIPLLGGERAIIEPWRLACFWLYLAYKDRFLDLKIKFVKNIDRKKWQILKNMYLADFNAPLASSMGRLFDAAASIVLARYNAAFEAQLAIELEKKCAGILLNQRADYNFKIIKRENKFVIDPVPMFKEIVADLENKERQEDIANKFHFTVARMIRKTCIILRDEYKINKVVLSGGCFQNNILFRSACALLSKEEFEVVTHKILPCNDACISLGQAVITATRN
ncbi:MAG: hypothetical protein KJ880_06845 [Candidatus Omnitrophica bacterium]|nr:hypothetical protein [Candidatus Omnitrophota bacterium]MBU1869365.1 hypothetical protein [Candidatus Omnitrophota bacterium]